MIIRIQRISQYILLLFLFLFLIWLSIITIIYQNKQCYSIEINKSIYNYQNISNIDSRFKLNHFTILGTHNSYHSKSLFYKYQHPQLDKQLSFGVRQIELDIHLITDHYLVYHLQLFDDKTNCYCLNECLMKIAKWNDENRFHYPIYLFIEIKQKFYEDLLTGLRGGVKCQHFHRIKNQILEVFSLNTFILPKQIQGNETSIKIALKKQRENELKGDYTYQHFGWPPLYQSLGKIIPVFIDDVQNLAIHLYPKCNPLREFFFIAQTNIDLPYSSIISIQNPINNQQLLINSANNGLINRILIGYGGNNLDQTYLFIKPYGINIISSDSLQCNHTLLCQYLSKDFQNSTILCNNYSAPSFCNSSLNFI